MIYVLLADGFEDVEAITTVDYLRRAKLNVQTVGVDKREVKSSHNIIIMADITLDEMILDDMELVVLPGGLDGTHNLKNNKTVLKTINYAYKNCLIAAICAAPSILGEMGLLKGMNATCYPGFENKLIGATILKDNVVIDKNIITSKSAGTACDFAFAIISKLKSIQTANEVREQILLPIKK